MGSSTTTSEAGKAAALVYKLGNQNSGCKRLGTKVVQFSQIWRTRRNLFNLNTTLERQMLFFFPLIQQGKAVLTKMFFKEGLGILTLQSFFQVAYHPSNNILVYICPSWGILTLRKIMVLRLHS